MITILIPTALVIGLFVGSILSDLRYLRRIEQLQRDIDFARRERDAWKTDATRKDP